MTEVIEQFWYKQNVKSTNSKDPVKLLVTFVLETITATCKSPQERKGKGWFRHEDT